MNPQKVSPKITLSNTGCRVTDLKPLPNYMDGKRTCVTFTRVKEGGAA